MARFEVDELHALGVALDFAARLVQVEPSEEWVECCVRDRLFEAAPFGGDDEFVIKGLSLMESWCESAADSISDSAKTLQREWLRLFIGLGSPEASISESFYTEPNSALFGKTTLAVRESYKAWGLESDRRLNEPDDTLGRMLVFCAHLSRIAAEAQDSGDQARAVAALVALEEFIVDHLLPWASAWRFLVSNHAATGYYRGVGEFVFGLEHACADRFGIGFDSESGHFFYRK